MQLLVEYLEDGVRVPVPDVVVDGEGDALERVLQVGLGHRGVVQEDGGAGARLLQLAHGPGVREVHLALLPDHPIWKFENKSH